MTGEVAFSHCARESEHNEAQRSAVARRFKPRNNGHRKRAMNEVQVPPKKRTKKPKPNLKGLIWGFSASDGT